MCMVSFASLLWGCANLSTSGRAMIIVAASYWSRRRSRISQWVITSFMNCTSPCLLSAWGPSRNLSEPSPVNLHRSSPLSFKRKRWPASMSSRSLTRKCPSSFSHYRWRRHPLASMLPIWSRSMLSHLDSRSWRKLRKLSMNSCRPSQKFTCLSPTKSKFRKPGRLSSKLKSNLILVSNE